VGELAMAEALKNMYSADFITRLSRDIATISQSTPQQFQHLIMDEQWQAR